MVQNADSPGIIAALRRGPRRSALRSSPTDIPLPVLAELPPPRPAPGTFEGLPKPAGTGIPQTNGRSAPYARDASEILALAVGSPIAARSGRATSSVSSLSVQLGPQLGPAAGDEDSRRKLKLFSRATKPAQPFAGRDESDLGLGSDPAERARRRVLLFSGEKLEALEAKVAAASRNLIQIRMLATATAGEYQNSVLRCLRLQALSGIQDASVPLSSLVKGPGDALLLMDGARVAYWAYVKPWVLRILALLFGIFSLLITWSEVTVFAPANLSVVHILLDAFAASPVGSQLVSIIPLSYMLGCAYWSLFRLRLFNYYRMVPGNHTGTTSVVFSSSYLTKLVVPLSWNFVNMSQLLSTTGFGSVMASMDFLPLFGVSFYTYWPVILLVFVLASLFNLSTKISRALRLPAFEFDEPEVMYAPLSHLTSPLPTLTPTPTGPTKTSKSSRKAADSSTLIGPASPHISAPSPRTVPSRPSGCTPTAHRATHRFAHPLLPTAALGRSGRSRRSGPPTRAPHQPVSQLSKRPSVYRASNST
jgi:hypothetical protein